jgi:hypothetical protein
MLAPITKSAITFSLSLTRFRAHRTPSLGVEVSSAEETLGQGPAVRRRPVCVASSRRSLGPTRCGSDARGVSCKRVSIARIARALVVGAQLFQDWAKGVGMTRGTDTGGAPWETLEQENRRLRRENELLRQ